MTDKNDRIYVVLRRLGATLKTYWLTDGQEIWHSANFLPEELEEEQSKADKLGGGEFTWVEEKPDLPEASTFRHIRREDLMLEKRRP